MNNLSFTTAKIYAIAFLIFGNQADSNSSMLIVEFHQIPRAVEAPAFMHGGKAQANLFAYSASGYYVIWFSPCPSPIITFSF